MFEVLEKTFKEIIHNKDAYNVISYNVSVGTIVINPTGSEEDCFLLFVNMMNGVTSLLINKIRSSNEDWLILEVERRKNQLVSDTENFTVDSVEYSKEEVWNEEAKAVETVYTASISILNNAVLEAIGGSFKGLPTS